MIVDMIRLLSWFWTPPSHIAHINLWNIHQKFDGRCLLSLFPSTLNMLTLINPFSGIPRSKTWPDSISPQALIDHHHLVIACNMYQAIKQWYLDICAINQCMNAGLVSIKKLCSINSAWPTMATCVYTFKEISEQVSPNLKVLFPFQVKRCYHEWNCKRFRLQALKCIICFACLFSQRTRWEPSTMMYIALIWWISWDLLLWLSLSICERFVKCIQCSTWNLRVWFSCQMIWAHTAWFLPIVIQHITKSVLPGMLFQEAHGRMSMQPRKLQIVNSHLNHVASLLLSSAPFST